MSFLTRVVTPYKIFFISLFIFLISERSSGQLINWAFNAGSSGNDIGNSTYVDNAGNVYAAGGFTGTADFDPTGGTANLSSNGSKDIFIAKYNSSGQYLWAFSIGGSGIDDVNGITTDPNGNVLITGFFRGSNVDFDPSAAIANLSSNGDAGSDPGYGGDIFIAKYNSIGQYQWAFNIGGTQLLEAGIAIVTDGAGNVYAGGYFLREVVDFDPSIAVNSLNSASGTFFLAKYSPAGAFQWALNAGQGNVDNAIFDLKTDNAGNVFAVGYFQGINIDFDPSPATALLSSNGGFEIFFAKYNTNGQYQFAHKIGGGGTDVGRGIELDNAGNIYIIGDFNGSNIDFNPSAGSTLLTSTGSGDVFLAKYNNTGQYVWAFSFGGAANDIGWKVSTDNSHLFISGGFTGTSDMNPSASVDNLVSSGGNDIFLGKYTLNGEYLCSFKIGSTGDDYGTSIKTNGTNTFYLTGSFQGSNVDFDPTISTFNLNSNGGDDIFLAKYTWPDNILPTGFLSGNTICNTQPGQLTFTATTGTGPFTIVYYNGITNITQNNVQSGVPFNVIPNPSVTTVYTLVSIKDVTHCGETNLMSGNATISVGSMNFDFYYQQNVCNPLSVQFFNSGPDNQNPYWDFGDGIITTGTLQPVHTYAGYGNYIVKHSVNNGTCSDTITKTITVNVTQDNTLITTTDTTICFSTTKQLFTKPSLNFCWSPTIYLNNPNSPNPITSTPQNITYYITAEQTGMNVISNGDFSAGNTGFTSGYVYTTLNLTEGEYFIGTSPQAWNTSLSNCSDHTSGNGNMMLVNGSPVPDVNVWKQTVAVTPNTNYAFSTWIQPLWSPNPAQLQFSINGKDIGNLITASLPTCTWTQFYTTWNSGNNSSAVISILNKNTQVQGNDFALDDISFAPVFIKRDSVKIIVDTPFVRTNNDTTICQGSTVQLNAIGALAYTWSPATGLSNINIANPAASPIINSQYIVSGTNSNGCIAKDTVAITLYPKPIVTTSNDTTICGNAVVQLSAAGGTVYQWSPAATLSNPSIANPIASPLTNTTYIVNVTDANTCSNKDSVIINIKPPPAFAVSADAGTCIGEPYQLNASGGDIYIWSPASSLSDPAINDPFANPGTSTVYTVNITESSCNTSAQLSTILIVFPLPNVQANKSNDLDCSYDFSQLSASGASTYLWMPAVTLNNPGINNPVARPTVTTQYIVQGTDNNGCINNDSVVVKVEIANKGGYLMPNAFTPNNDGLNDCFSVRYWGVILELDFHIYNRWGELVFRTNNPTKCWDGTYKGMKQNPGVFVYMIKAKTNCENSVFRKGTLVLIR